VKIALVQLGCPKNLVDGEWVLGQLREGGHQLVPPEEAEALLINTCAFIRDAKEESLEKIIEAVELKKKGKISKVVVFGCLSERYRDELAGELPEVDGFFPLSAIREASSMLSGKTGGVFRSGDVPLPEKYSPRLRLTPPHLAYVKIGEGCGHSCSFCAIPMIRGKSRSRSLKSVMEELRKASGSGAREAVIISQDTASWKGKDGSSSLCSMVKAINKAALPIWVRIMYLYPTKVTTELIHAWSSSDAVLPYFDIPLQHASGRVLEAMRRPGSAASYMRLIEKIRKTFNEPCIRSSFIVGFPNERKADHEELISFLKDAELDNVGFFEYSREEGTPAYKLGDRVPSAVKRERLEEAAAVQREISAGKNSGKVGRVYKVLVEGVSEESDLLLEGRAWFQAPEIDGKTYITKGRAVTGGFSAVKITDAHHYDLAGEIVSGRKKNVG